MYGKTLMARSVATGGMPRWAGYLPHMDLAAFIGAQDESGKVNFVFDFTTDG
jgi:hypothetical protein